MQSVTIFFCVIGFSLLMAIVLIASSIRIVHEDTRLSLYRLGQYVGDKGPGLVLVIPFIDRGVLKNLGGMDKIRSRKFEGDVGETRTTVYTDGKVFVAGEKWDAISQSPISAGQRVRVIRIILEVEKE